MHYQACIKLLSSGLFLVSLAACQDFSVQPTTPPKPVALTTITEDSKQHRDYATLQGYQLWQAQQHELPLYQSDLEHTPILTPRLPKSRPNLINPMTSETYLPVSNGYLNSSAQLQTPRIDLGKDLLNPHTGEIYRHTGTGYISPQGHFLPDYGNGLIGTPSGLVTPLPY